MNIKKMLFILAILGLGQESVGNIKNSDTPIYIDETTANDYGFTSNDNQEGISAATMKEYINKAVDTVSDLCSSKTTTQFCSSTNDTYQEELHTKVDNLSKEVESTKQQVGIVSDRVGEVEQRVSKAEEKVEEIKEQVDTIDTNKEKKESAVTDVKQRDIDKKKEKSQYTIDREEREDRDNEECETSVGSPISKEAFWFRSAVIVASFFAIAMINEHYDTIVHYLGQNNID